MYCPRCWRNTSATAEGTSTPLRHQARRSTVLLHDLWLDDVELARDWSCIRRNRDALRRFSISWRREVALRLHRAGTHQTLWRPRQIYCRNLEERCVAD